MKNEIGTSFLARPNSSVYHIVVYAEKLLTLELLEFF